MSTGRVNMSLRDVTIAQVGNGARESGWHQAPEACGEFGGFWKSQLSSASGEDGWLSFACWSQASGLVAGATRVEGADGKIIIERLWISLPYVETFNSKVIKGFVPELRSRKCFSCFEIPMSYIYVLWTFYVHFVYPYHGYGTHWNSLRLNTYIAINIITYK